MFSLRKDPTTGHLLKHTNGKLAKAPVCKECQFDDESQLFFVTHRTQYQHMSSDCTDEEPELTVELLGSGYLDWTGGTGPADEGSWVGTIEIWQLVPSVALFCASETVRFNYTCDGVCLGSSWKRLPSNNCRVDSPWQWVTDRSLCTGATLIAPVCASGTEQIDNESITYIEP